MAGHAMLQSWWIFAIRGVIAIAFGVAALAWPGFTLLWLVALFAAYALLVGVATVVGAVKWRDSDALWWQVLILGLICIGVGALAIAYPDATVVALVILFGINALITGVLDVFVAMRLRRHISGEWLLLLSGVFSIAFGMMVVLFPTGAGALALVWLMGCYALVIGVLFLVLAFRVRAWLHRTGSGKRFPVGSL